MMDAQGGNHVPQGGGTRRPAVAGQFYPAGAERLAAEVDRFLSDAHAAGTDDVQALIVPHAGYVFSGGMAGRAFARIAPATCYKRVFLLGPSHRVAFGGVSVNAADSRYVTPLGDVAVDSAVCGELLQDDKLFCHLPQAHEKEHCLEVELPFLQRRLAVMPPIVPLIVGTQDYSALERLADRLLPYFTPENLFVVSSDFSHYPSYADAQRVDRETGEAILSALPEVFLDTLARNAARAVRNLLTSACGQAPITVLLLMMSRTRGLKMEHLGYCNSGDSPYGTRGQVVGYHAFAVRRQAAASCADAPSDNAQRAFSLTADEKEQLLRIARKSIESVLAENRGPLCDETRLTDRLRTDGGAFVTLYLHGNLRGCIGNLVGRGPLYQTVADMARAAAFDDPRFGPLRADELPEVRIDISVLSPLRRIHSADEFQLGRHGIFMVKGGRQGTFLPQVAEETHWTKEEFLGHCARDKAGLPWDGWKDAELYVYEAEVFHEDDAARCS